MKESTITVRVKLDEQKVPQEIFWNATDSTADEAQKANAMMLSFWEPTEKAALRIDLWTNELMVDEMVDFYYQSMLGMAETLQRSTGQQELATDLRAFATTFFQKFQEAQRKNA